MEDAHLTANRCGFFCVVFQITKAEVPIKAFQLRQSPSDSINILSVCRLAIPSHCSLSLMDFFFSFHFISVSLCPVLNNFSSGGRCSTVIFPAYAYQVTDSFGAAVGVLPWIS